MAAVGSNLFNFKRVYQMKKYAEMVLVAWVAVAIGKKLPVIQNYL
jgi:hypothetical protein